MCLEFVLSVWTSISKRNDANECSHDVRSHSIYLFGFRLSIVVVVVVAVVILKWACRVLPL